MIAGFRNLYKQRIPYDLYWVPLSAGGLHLRAQFVYADVTEYVAILAAGGNTIGRGGKHMFYVIVSFTHCLICTFLPQF